MYLFKFYLKQYLFNIYLFNKYLFNICFKFFQILIYLSNKLKI